MNERVQTTLRFVGDWPWWAGVSGAVALAGLVVWLYRPDLRGSAAWLRIALPALRSTAVAMIALMLSGPVLHHRKVIGELSRLLLLVDTSRSMGLSDASMDLGRKLRILQEMKMVPPDAVKMELPNAGEALADAVAISQKAAASLNAESSDWSRLLSDFATKATEARDLLPGGGFPTDRVAALSKELVDPSREIERREMRQIDDRQNAVRDLSRLASVAERWSHEISGAFQKSLTEGGGASANVQAALQRFDALPRAQRLQKLLLEGDKGKLLENLAETHEVQLLALNGTEVTKLWESANGAASAPTGLPRPESEVTDLGGPLESLVGKSQGTNERGAVVLFSDGQHNDGTAPVEAARILGGRKLALFPVGFGSTSRPRDVAVLKVDAPESVYADDVVRGQITIKDDLSPGAPFKLSVLDGEKELWSQAFTSQGISQRKVPFEFKLKEATALAANERSEVKRSNTPVEVKVQISAAEGDGEAGNNSANLRLRAVTQKRQILLLDGRPRWESRYLRNMFERDEQWQMNSVVAGTTAGETGLLRGAREGAFPTDLSLLAAYDLIIFGEVPRALLKPEELQAIRDFVEKRGGAIAFIDGPRAALREYGDTPLGALFPVDLRAAKPTLQVARLALLEAAQSLAPFTLNPDRARNTEVWRTLPVPHWISGAPALPGAEVYVEAEVPGGKAPAIVARNFGAGHVLYQAFDDSWRWRYEVADQYHVRYWNQIADWIAELPFAARDRFISLDAGAITYRPGEAADLRVRLRDGEGRPVSNATVDAVLHRDGQRVATIRLSAEENAGGLFRGRTAALEPGQYEVSVETAAIPEAEAKARTSFKVEPRATGELAQLSLNEDLLRQMAIAAGGQYWREENIHRLVDALAPLSNGRVIESETVLWQSYWWFLPLLGLLGTEWFLRKRTGML